MKAILVLCLCRKCAFALPMSPHMCTQLKANEADMEMISLSCDITTKVSVKQKLMLKDRKKLVVCDLHRMAITIDPHPTHNLTHGLTQIPSVTMPTHTAQRTEIFR